MNYLDSFKYWKTDEFFDMVTRQEFSALDPVVDTKEIEDRLYRDLETMTMGIPVVTTPIGAENIDATNGEDWLIAEDDQEFADSVCLLWKIRNRETE